MPTENPKPKKGQRDPDCNQYDKCLTFAARQNWTNMSCESCPCFTKGHNKLINQKKGPHIPSSKTQPEKAYDARTIEYFKYVSIFNEIKRLAEDENKQIDLELIYLLRTYFRFKKRYRPLLERFYPDLNEYLSNQV